MLQLLHQIVDFLPGILLPLVGQVEVNHGGFQPCMAEELLNAAQVDSGLQQMGGIGVAQSVDANVLFCDAGELFCSAKSALDTAFGHGQGGGGCLFAVSADGGKDKMRMSMRFPVLSQDIDGCVRQGDIAVLRPFAAVDMEHPSCTVDI